METVAERGTRKKTSEQMKKKETVIITEVQEMCPRLESNHMPKENDDTNAESQREKRNKNKKKRHK